MNAVDRTRDIYREVAILDRDAGAELQVLYGISWGQALALLYLAEQPEPVTAIAIAAALGRGRAASSRMLESLRRAGLVIAVDNPTDRRRWNITISAQGRSVLDQAEDVIMEIACAFLDNLPPIHRD